MNDPFFDEDDGEFDDLYGNPPASASSPAIRRKPGNNEAPVVQPVTPGGRPSTASSSVVSRSYTRDRAGSTTSHITDLGKQEKRRKRHGKPRRKGSQELFDVHWQSDVHVSKCGLCRSDFSLVRRKHHCRHCGRVMCSDCSSFLYFEFSHRKHRVCATCNNQLLAEQDAYDRETLVADSQEQNTNLFDSSDDGRPSVTPVSSTSNDAAYNNRRSTSILAKDNGSDKKARKKQEKKQNKREKVEKKEKTTQVITTVATPSRVQSEKKPATTLFDGADDDWFTDVPDQQRSRNSGDEDSDHGGSKGPGWRDHVKDTYNVTAASEQTSVLASMTGGTLTAGITGKVYISDQFRYDDVGGPGLGHDDDISVEMPRPKQQFATATYTDHSVKPSRLTGNGYYSEQFQYDVGGPGLGHNDDRTVAMPRPKQQPVVAPYSYNSAKPSPRQLEHDTFDDSAPPEQDFEPRLTLKDNLKDMFGGRESTANKREKKGNKPRARGNESMTLDELYPSYSSEDEPRMAMPRPTATTIQPTFYENDADKLVVDDSPGFFEATMEEREAQRKKEEEQQRQLASDMAWVNSSALPPSVRAHRFSSEQESYSIVDPPSHTSNSPVESRRDGGSGGEDAAGNGKGGFTGALKRFFGMGSKGAGKRTTTRSKPAKTPRTPVATAPKKDSTEKHASAVPDSNHTNSATIAEPVSGGLERHTVLDYYGTPREEAAPQESFRNTMAGYVDSKDVSSRFEASMPSQIGDTKELQQKPERKRRDTFDDLFESPKNNVAVGNADRYSTTGANGWATRVGEDISADQASYDATAVGVSRFDKRRSIDEADGLTLGDEPRSVQPPSRTSNDPIAAWRQSAAMSLLDDRKSTSQTEGSGFTWNNVRSTPEFGTATYAVPTSLQPRAVDGDDYGSSLQYDAPTTQPAPLGNIMDDLKRGSTSKKAQGQESVEDFFAEFEEPNDYVFDPATGGYVAARVPPRAAVTRHVTRSESTELLDVPDKAARRNSERDYSAPSGPISSSTAATIASKDGDSEEVGDEVAEIIVDKISSLENELAALKQLIRSRKGSGGSNKPRVSRSTANPSVRKESIFDNDSSDEDDDKPGDPYTSSIRPLAKKASKRRPPSRKKHAKKRKDSFADLFEDSPNENETLGGTTSYEALFQTGAKVAGASKEEDSDDDEDLSPKTTKTRPKSRRRSSRKIKDFVPAKDDSDSEPEFTSLKGRRGKHSSRRKMHEDLDDATTNLTSRKTEGKLITPPSVNVVPAVMPVKKQVEEEDPIDALFDISNNRDVTNLYGGDEIHDEEEKKSALESEPAPVLKDTSALFTHMSSTSPISDTEASGTPSSTAASMESVAPVNRANSGLSYSLESQDIREADEEEDFSINWSKMRKSKSRRHKSRKGSSKTFGEPISKENTTEDLPLESNLLHASTELEVEVNYTPAEHKEAKAPVPSTFLADAALNWMSVSTLEVETINLSLTGDGDLESLVQSEDEGKYLEPPAESVIKNVDERFDNADIIPAPVSVDELQIEAIAPGPDTNNMIPSEENDGPVENVPASKVNIVDEPLDTKAHTSTVTKVSGFDIFDKSGDVDFLSETSHLAHTTPDHEGDIEDDEKESVPDDIEDFSFEIKAPKMRPSALEMPGSISSASSVSERGQSSPPSPTSSADDNVEFGKYATPSAPSSSRTPSIDGSLDDPEDISVDDEPVLGKVESQAFDTDWQHMQAKEKERKKRLQVKQRQAQRDKVLRKQGVSSKSLSNSASTPASSKNKSKSGKKKKKKKDKEKDDSAPSSSHHKKSSSTRKHRRREKEDGDHAAPSEPPRSLTEL